MRKAVGSSSVCGCVIAISGMIGFILHGYKVEGLPDYSVGYVFACFGRDCNDVDAYDESRREDGNQPSYGGLEEDLCRVLDVCCSDHAAVKSTCFISNKKRMSYVSGIFRISQY